MCICAKDVLGIRGGRVHNVCVHARNPEAPEGSCSAPRSPKIRGSKDVAAVQSLESQWCFALEG